MAKLRGPLLSLDARQKLGGRLSYQTRTQLKRVTAIPIPSQPQTLPQVYHRQDYQDYVLWWNLLPEADKAAYQALAAGRSFTPYNAWMRDRLLTLPDLGARWHFDAPRSGVYLDSSKNANSLTPFGPVQAPGIWGNCLSFDGVDDYCRAAVDASYRPADALWVETWFYPTALQHGRPLVDMIVFGANQGYGLYTWNDRIRFQLGNGAVRVQAEGDADFILNQWLYALGTFDGRYVRLYLNNILQAIVGDFGALTTIQYPVELLYVGGNIAPNALSGRLEELRVYNRVPAEAERTQHWLRGARVLGLAS